MAPCIAKKLTPEKPRRPLANVATVRIQVLGPLKVSVDGESLVLGGPKQRLVLALLAARADQAVPTDRLIDEIWQDEDPPAKPRKTVQVYVANLRKELSAEPAPIEGAAGGYVLRTAGASVDAVDFEEAVAEAVAAIEADTSRARQQLGAALAMWNGTPYADLSDAPALGAEITRLNELRITALEHRLEADLALGQHRVVLSELDTLTTDHPYRERFRALQMMALYRSGRQAEALRAYQRTRLLLAEEMGIDPTPELRALEQQILAQDPSLDARGTSDELGPADVALGGRSIRGYELREQLSESDGSSLWRAYQPTTGREVALQVFGLQVSNEPSFVKRFESEAQLVAELEHPHLISIYDFWRDPDGAYLVMPFMHAGSLAIALQSSQWNTPAALRLLDQLGAGLAMLHRHGISHGHLIPENVLLDGDANAYLVGAGITGGLAISAPSSDVSDLAALLGATLSQEDTPDALRQVIEQATAPTDGDSRVEDFLRAVRQAVGADAVGVASDAGPKATAARNPYKGLRAFRETDAADFFGRDELVTTLVETVAANSLTTVVGSSGSGKSSLVKAGLIPAVRGGALNGDWLIAEMFPGSFPFEELEAALLRVAVDRPDRLMADLTGDDRGMLRVIKRVLPDDGTGLVLIIDQFEELFSLTPDEDSRRLFLESLVTLGSDARSRVRTVLTMRADFFDRPLDYPEFGEAIRDGLITVSMPDRDSLAQMVSQPARQAGLELEPGLVTEVVRDVAEQPGGLPLMQYALTEMTQRSDGYTLMSGDYTVTLDDYRASGGVLGALGQRAEEIYQDLQPSARSVAERVFLRLVTVDENADDTRRRVRRTELNALGLDANAVDAVLQEFGSFRLLSFDHDPTTRGPMVEVAHEALIREWPRMQSWVDDQREDLLLERRLREAVADWEANNRDPSYLLRGGRLAQFETWAHSNRAQTTDDERHLIDDSRAAADEEREAERQRVRRLRRLVVGVGAALIVALIAGGLALREQNRADDEAQLAQTAAADADAQRVIAEDQTAVAEEQTRLAEEQAAAAFQAAEEADLATLISRSAALTNGDPEVAVLLALEAHRRAPGPETDQAVLNALGSSTLVNRVASDFTILEPGGACDRAVVASNGLTSFPIVGGQLESRDLLTGEATQHGPAQSVCGQWFQDETFDRRIEIASDLLKMWFGPSDGPFEVVREFDEPTDVLLSSFRPKGRLMAASFTDEGSFAVLLDDETGETVGTPFLGGAEPLGVGATPNGSIFAIGELFVLDGETGDVLFNVDSPLPAENMTFDIERNELVAAMFGGTVMTVDLSTGEVVSEVAASTTTNLLDIGVGADGLITLVSQSQIEFLDRFEGSVGRNVAVRNAGGARIRPDGTVITFQPDSSLEIFDLQGGALVEQAIDVEPLASFAFNSGLAGAALLGGTTTEVVDLASGTKSKLDLITPEGDQFVAVKIYPEPDGVWAVDVNNVVARWEGDRMVEQIDIGEGLPLVGTRYLDLWAYLSDDPAENRVLNLMNLERGATGVVFTVPAPDGADAHPTREGGAHLIEADGTVLTYDASGQLINEVETGVSIAGVPTLDPATGRLAISSGAFGGVVIVDFDTGEVEALPMDDFVVNHGFARNGELLAVTSPDGAVRLWDVGRLELAGVVWPGNGAVGGSPSWYDEETETIWVHSSAKLLQIPVNPDRWIEKACEAVGRGLTQDEWDRYVPGDELLWDACI